MQNTPKRKLFSVYDFQVCPPTFDVLLHLYSAEMYRIRHGYSSIHFVIAMSDDEHGFRKDSTNIWKKEQCEWRLKNILIPATNLLPSIGSMSICRTREELHTLLGDETALHPPGYQPKSPIKAYLVRQPTIQWLSGSTLPALQASKTAHGLAQSWIKQKIGGRPFITVTLRRTSFLNQVRNSKIEAWAKFVKSIKDKYTVVLLDDFEYVFGPHPPGFEDCITAPSTMFSMELRSSLYQHARLNLLVGNGPVALCMTNPYCRFLCFLNYSPQDTSQNHTISLAQVLRRFGDNTLAWFNPFQKYVWGEETLQLIQDNFSQMEAIISSGKYRSKSSVLEYIQQNRKNLIEEDKLIETIKELVSRGAVYPALNVTQDVLRFGDGFQQEKYRQLEELLLGMLKR
jgi:hypothetical protein